ncbi:MAG: YdeI/OmpD-associated family protein [Patescibacteria group bacterium]
MERTLPDLKKVLATNKKAQATWEDLTPIARRDFISWIESAKQPETRKRRVESLPSRLASGKRRPCCYAIVPTNLYKALDFLPKAKKLWKDLTPDEKRDFTDWINTAKDSEARTKRIEKACALLLAGKRRPQDK